LVYTFNPLTSSYDLVNISEACGKGFWIYAHKDTSLEVLGTQLLTAKDISLIGNRNNLIAIPKGGLRINSQKGNCKLSRFYYYNSTDNTWYRWNATTNEYSRYNAERNTYQLLRVDSDPFIPEGLAVFVYTENDCRFAS